MTIIIEVWNFYQKLSKISNHLSSSSHNIASSICLLSIQIFYLLLLFLQQSSSRCGIKYIAADSVRNYQRKENVYFTIYVSAKYPYQATFPLKRHLRGHLTGFTRLFTIIWSDNQHASDIWPMECQCSICINQHFLINQIKWCTVHATIIMLSFFHFNWTT